MTESDGWSNSSSEKGPFTVFMADGSNYPDVANYREAVRKADEQPGSKVRGLDGGVAYESREKQITISCRSQRSGSVRSKRSTDLI